MKKTVISCVAVLVSMIIPMSAGAVDVVYTSANLDSACKFTTSYMKLGGNNNTSDVTKLQNFLKNTEKIDVDVNGIFDQKTQGAVIAFQDKYAETIMGPWGAKKGNGDVSIITIKKIAQIACGQPLTLNTDELSIITDIRNRIAKPVIVSTESQIQVLQLNSDLTLSTTSIDSEVVSSSTDDEATSTVKTSVFGRFWNFIVGLFI